MEDERKRILRMLTEGQITVEECEELLQALEVRDAERVHKEKKRAKEGERPRWPFLLVVLLVAWVLIFRVAVPWMIGVQHRGISLLPIPELAAGFGSLIGLAFFIFWLVMLVNCLTRKLTEFRLLFTQKFQYEKWIWVAIIVLGQVLGALVYFIVVVQRAGVQEAVPRRPEQKQEEEPAEAPLFTPRRRAHALWPWVTLLIALSLMGGLAAGFLASPIGREFGMGHPPHPTPMYGLLLAPLGLLALFLSLFCIWMLIDCLTRDYREFGTLLCSDRSADKLFWLLIILCLPLVGAVAYHIGVRRLPREERGLSPACDPVGN